jgi:hypothetical protein
VFTPGAAARIEVTTTTVAGGHAMIVTERVDSARATYSSSSCSQPVVGGTCNPVVQPARTLGQAELDALFGLVSSAEFRAVRASYRRAGSVVPPDAMQVQLDVTVGERSRTVTWERDAVLPNVLLELRCAISSVGGWLGLCVEEFQLARVTGTRSPANP